MSRDDADAEAVHSALARGHCALIKVTAATVGLVTLVEGRDAGVANLIVIRLAVVGLNADVLWIDGSKVDVGGNAESVADRNVMPVFVANLDIGHFDLCPIFPDAGFPLAQLDGI